MGQILQYCTLYSMYVHIKFIFLNIAHSAMPPDFRADYLIYRANKQNLRNIATFKASQFETIDKIDR
jgi:hypothetical protein